MATQHFPLDEIIGLFCDTKFEHPLTYDHVESFKERYGIKIDTVNGGNVIDKCLHYSRFPGGGARFCTDELKIQETKKYLKKLVDTQGVGFEVWYGMRTGESSQRANRYDGKLSGSLYEPHEVLQKYPKYLGKLGVKFRLPIIDWCEDDVFDYLDGEENPLYDMGFSRVGCFPCLAGGDKSKEIAFKHDDFGKSQYKKVMMVSEIIGKNIFTSKGGRSRNPNIVLDDISEDVFELSRESSGSGCSFCEM